ncbi:DUF6516 family protein [Cytobacillus sp. FJAT-53684]|uniref:DUF6516 family protein n=1 Tax=Cytobacillus mangrovibacter TaxID=3299024 RepID=A0ABW6JX39_9BACI
MSKEFERRKKVADLSEEFSFITNGSFHITGYKENRIDKKTGEKYDLLIANIPLINHPIYGETKITIREEYRELGLRYHYGWEKVKGGKQGRHITSFGNEPHPDGPWTVKNTEPYHHHHVPEEPIYRKDCEYIRSLKDVFEFVEEFLVYKNEYTQDINT